MAKKKRSKKKKASKKSSKKKKKVSKFKFVKKQHGVGWITAVRIGILAFIIYAIVGLMVGVDQNLRELLVSSFWFGVIVILLLALIVGIVKLSENTDEEIKRLNK